MLLNKLLEELPAEIDGAFLTIYKLPMDIKMPTWLVCYYEDAHPEKYLYETRDNEITMALLKMKRLLGDDYVKEGDDLL